MVSPETVDHLTFPLSFFAETTCITAALLFLNLIFSNKFSAVSLASFSICIFLFNVISGRTLYFANFFDIINDDQQSFGKLLIFFFCGVAGSLLIWFLLRRDDINETKTRNISFAICGFYAFLAVILYFAYPFGMPIHE